MGRFHKAFPPYPRKPGARWVSGNYIDFDGACALKAFIQKELARERRIRGTGSEEVFTEMGNYKLSTSLPSGEVTVSPSHNPSYLSSHGPVHTSLSLSSKSEGNL